MEDNLHLKRGLITQSLSPAFFLLLIRHIHPDFLRLIRLFFTRITAAPAETVMTAVLHPRFGEILIVVIGLVWIIVSALTVPGFLSTQESGFVSEGEKVVVTEEKKDAAASFLMTFILPLLIDELGSPQHWFSYIIVIAVVFATLSQSNLYYQSPILAFLGYKVFAFRVVNPALSSGLKADKEYIGITKNKAISQEAAVMWKHIADDVYLVYNEGNGKSGE